jgi:hypothetical protein
MVRPTPTTAPSAYGLKSYQPMSSSTNKYAQNYQTSSTPAGWRAPMALSSQLNAYGAPLYTANAYNTSSRVVNTNPSTGQVLGANTGPNPNPQPQPGPAPSTGGPIPGVEDINKQTEDYGAIIDQEYNDQMGILAGQEAGVGEQAGIANRTAEGGATSAKNAYAQEGQTKIGAQEQNITTGQTQGATAMQQARDLFRQTQQQNIAQLSGLGISSSSVAEAMAETLGVETARRIAGVTGSVQEIVQNATKEIGNIKGYVAQKQAEVENDLKIKKDEIQAWVNQQINTIAGARNQAATAKAQQRMELFSNAQNIVSNLVNQAQTYQAQLDQWAQQKASTLSQYSTPESAQNLLNNMMANLQANYSPTQYDISGKMNYNNTSGYYPTTSVTPKKKTTGATTEDENNPGFDIFGNPLTG